MTEEKALYKPAQTDIMERVLISGDLKDLTPGERVKYYGRVCESIGLNPLTKPFDYIVLNGKMTLYAKRDATDQLRARDKVSIVKLERERMDDIYVVTAYAQTSDGRQDSSVGAVSISGLKGDALANAIMKAETKAKRRVTLSIVGLGWLDETEIETIPTARPVIVKETGEITSAEPPAQPEPPLHETPQQRAAARNAFRIPEWFVPSEKNLAAARALTITFGKHAGMTLGDIDDTDKAYIAWLTESFEPKTPDAEKVLRAATYLRSFRKHMERDYHMPVDLVEDEQPPLQEQAA